MVVVLVVRDVSARSGVAELLSEAEIDNIDDVVCLVSVFALGNDKVCGLDVAMDKVS